MAHLFKKHKLKKVNKFILSITIFLVIGIISFILAYGISEGWNVVAAWFSSSDAILLYCLLGLYGIIVTIVLLRERYKKL